MSMKSAWYTTVHCRFREVFGEPDTTVGRDDHWSLRPPGPYRASINVLVNGGGVDPLVWVFDPHTPGDGISHATIKTEIDLDMKIKEIEHRLQRAAARSR